MMILKGWELIVALICISGIFGYVEFSIVCSLKSTKYILKVAERDNWILESYFWRVILKKILVKLLHRLNPFINYPLLFQVKNSSF